MFNGILGKGSHEDFSLRYRDFKVKKVIIIGLVYGALDTSGDDIWGRVFQPKFRWYGMRMSYSILGGGLFISHTN